MRSFHKIKNLVGFFLGLCTCWLVINVVVALGSMTPGVRRIQRGLWLIHQLIWSLQANKESMMLNLGSNLVNIQDFKLHKFPPVSSSTYMEATNPWPYSPAIGSV